jgi:hypothetical protein
MNKFLHRYFSRLKMGFELKIWEFKVYFYFRKLIKIARNGSKIQEFAWSYEIKFGTLLILVISSKYLLILN